MRYSHPIEQFYRAQLRGLLALSCFLAFCLQCSFSHAAEVELFFAHPTSRGSLYDVCVSEFARRVNAKLPTGYRVTVAGDSSLGDSTAILDKLKAGQIALGISSSAMSSVSDKFAIFELPFLIHDRAQIQRVSLRLLDRFLEPEAEKKGYRILALWENGFRHITNDIRPIRKPEDLRGMKIRVPKGSLLREKIFRALGAEPIVMPLHETHGGLSRGEINAQENPLQIVKAQRFWEVQKFLSFSEHVYTPAYVVVGLDAFARLPDPVQQILTVTAVEMQPWVYQTALRMESDLIDELEEHMKTNQVDLKAFETATRPIYGEFIRSVEGGAKMVDVVMGMSER